LGSFFAHLEKTGSLLIPAWARWSKISTHQNSHLFCNSRKREKRI